MFVGVSELGDAQGFVDSQAGSVFCADDRGDIDTAVGADGKEASVKGRVKVRG